MEPLVGDGLCIRPYRDEDAPQFVAAVRESTASVGLWMPWCHPDYSLDEALAWFALCRSNMENRLAWDVGIFSAHETTGGASVFHGGIGINQISRLYNYGNLGYWIRASSQGRGLAARAARMMARYGFGELGLTRLEIVAIEDNHASRRTAEKAGASFECVARNRLVLHGEPRDAAVYSLVPGQSGRPARR